MAICEKIHLLPYFKFVLLGTKFLYQSETVTIYIKPFRALKALVNYHCKELQDIDHIFTIPAFFTDKCLKTIDVTCQNIL